MENRQLVLNHSNMMYKSQELIQLRLPVEVNVMMYTILVLFLCVGIAVCTVHVNDVIKVPGIIRTKENVSSVKNVLSGKIDQIYYSPGQLVKQGDILFSLNKDIYESLRKNLEIDISNIQKELTCIKHLLDGIYSGKNIIPERENAKSFTQLEEYFTKLAYLEEQKKYCDYKYQKELSMPNALMNQQNIEEAKMNVCLRQKEIDKYKAEILAKLIQAKDDNEKEFEKLYQALIRTEKEYSYLDVKAPVNGYIQEISSLNVGDYIFADQQVINIVPCDNKNFRVEMNITAKDIGEIEKGMIVKYRLSAFPFFEYKGAQGQITFIDSDVRKGSDGRLFYQAYADIDKVDFTNAKGESYLLRAGIDVDARIVMEKITLLQFILRKLDFVK